LEYELELPDKEYKRERKSQNEKEITGISVVFDCHNNKYIDSMLST
jgi:hypothetical protein